jgi:hypothetical protein
MEQLIWDIFKGFAVLLVLVTWLATRSDRR